MIYREFTEVTDCAAAADGGSLWVGLVGPSGKAGFVLIRSIPSRGTPQFGRVRSDAGELLSPADTQQLCLRLSELQSSSLPCASLVAEFVRVASSHAQPDHSS